MENIASSPAIQAARFELTQARENMSTRLNSSQNLVKAFEHFDLNQTYFDKSREGIQQLIAKTDSLSKLEIIFFLMASSGSFPFEYLYAINAASTLSANIR